MNSDLPPIIRPPKSRSPFTAILISTVVVLAIAAGLVFALTKRHQQRQADRMNATVELGQDISEKLEASAANKYPALGATADEILSHDNDNLKDEMLNALIWRLDHKIETRGWTNLTQVEQHIVAVYAMEGEILDGGFNQYFFNSTGEDAEIALAGLEEMGATSAVGLLERAMQQFPGGKPPADTEKRREVMTQIEATARPIWNNCDSEYYDRKEDTYALCLAYAKKNKANIHLP